MTGITATEACSDLYRLIDETAEFHQAMQETLYLLSVPSMRESLREGMDTPVDQCDEDLDW